MAGPGRNTGARGGNNDFISARAEARIRGGSGGSDTLATTGAPRTLAAAARPAGPTQAFRDGFTNGASAWGQRRANAEASTAAAMARMNAQPAKRLPGGGSSSSPSVQPGAAPIAPNAGAPNAGAPNVQLPTDPVQARRGDKRADRTLIDALDNPQNAGRSGAGSVLNAVYRLPGDGARAARTLQQFNGPRGQRTQLGV